MANLIYTPVVGVGAQERRIKIFQCGALRKERHSSKGESNKSYISIIVGRTLPTEGDEQGVARK